MPRYPHPSQGTGAKFKAMKDINSTFDPQLADLDRDDWYEAVEELAEEDG